MPERKRKLILVAALVALLLALVVMGLGRKILCSMSEGLPLCSDVEVQLPGLEADRLMGEARDHAANGRFEEALPLLLRARDLYVRRGNQAGEANAQAGIGDVAIPLGDTELAMESLTRARTLYEVLGDRAGLARSLRSLGDLQRENGQYLRAGERYAETSRPEKIRWPREGGESETGTGFTPGQLTIACESAVAVFMMHEERELISRINAFFGYPAINKIRFNQKAVRLEPTRPEPRALDRLEQKRLGAMLADVEDDTLRKALERLGTGVITRKKPKA